MHYNHTASPSDRGQLVKMLILLNHMVYFDQILHTYACQHCLNTDMRSSLFYGRGFAEHQSDRSVSENADLNHKVNFDKSLHT